MMKVRIGSFFMVAVLFLSGLTIGASASETNNQVNETNYTTEWCTVVLGNPRSSLNVRNSNGTIVAKLRHGQQVYVDTYDGGWARVSIRRRGRLGILGWVASEYLSC